MAKKLSIEMTTPERVALHEEAEFVVLPAFEGEMGVLPDHAPFLVQLQPGEVRVTGGGETRRFAVSGGFAQVKDNKIEIFAETAELGDQIDAERAHQALEKAKAELIRKDIDPLTLAAAEGAIRRAQVRLMVAARRRGAGKRPSPRET